MLAALLATIDRLILLAKGRIDGRRQVFKELLDPVFEDLAIIHSDYVKVFSEIELFFPGHIKTAECEWVISPCFMGTLSIEAPEYQERLAEAKKQLEAKRLEFEPVRVKLRTLAKELNDREFPKEETAFIRAVLEYFPRADLRPAQSNFRDFGELMQNAKNGHYIVSAIHRLIERHNRNWASVCETYAALRVAVSILR